MGFKERQGQIGSGLPASPSDHSRRSTDRLGIRSAFLSRENSLKRRYTMHFLGLEAMLSKVLNGLVHKSAPVVSLICKMPKCMNFGHAKIWAEKSESMEKTSFNSSLSTQLRDGHHSLDDSEVSGSDFGRPGRQRTLLGLPNTTTCHPGLVRTSQHSDRS